MVLSKPIMCGSMNIEDFISHPKESNSEKRTKLFEDIKLYEKLKVFDSYNELKILKEQYLDASFPTIDKNLLLISKIRRHDNITINWPRFDMIPIDDRSSSISFEKDKNKVVIRTRNGYRINNFFSDGFDHSIAKIFDNDAIIIDYNNYGTDYQYYITKSMNIPKAIQFREYRKLLNILPPIETLAKIQDNMHLFSKLFTIREWPDDSLKGPLPFEEVPKDNIIIAGYSNNKLYLIDSYKKTALVNIHE